MRQRAFFLLFLATAACEAGVAPFPTDPDAPTNLTYQLIPSGDPGAPLGVILEWTPPSSGRALTYDVYSRFSNRDEFGLRGTTTSPSFHDSGMPQLEYYVQAMDQDGQPMGESDVVFVDERNRLPAPHSLVSVTLNRGVELSWDPNAYEAAPEMFDFYRVYSTSWDVVQGCNESGWSLEGTTVSDGFVSRDLPNGVTRCFAISAISRDGHESLWSNVREDTPRYDARGVVLDASDVRAATSGFVFATSAGSAGAFGAIVSDTSSTADVVLVRGGDGTLSFKARRAEVRIAPYGVTPVSELTTIDRAPTIGYAETARALAGYAYVVRVQYADGVHYAAIRIVHVAADYVLFDFAFQSKPGSLELLRAAP
jgi:hypothetical protein